jgi:hypothetical protein
MHDQIPLTRDLVLIGGGHTHALVLRMWGMKPLPGVRLTVINPAPTAPYSGMLPGFVAGHYSKDDLDIDLIKLARFAGARVIVDKAKVNPNGGAIALGHPVGATGAILTVKTMYELDRIGGRYGLITMCIGGGQGIAMAIERL